MKYLIVGLGNIGPEYELTRHNVGFLTVDRLADKENVGWSSNRLAFTSEFKYKGRQIYLIKPTTYMNLSGKAVNYWMKELNIPKENILVIVDDVALPFGKLRMRGKGSAAGRTWEGVGNFFLNAAFAAGAVHSYRSGGRFEIWLLPLGSFYMGGVGRAAHLTGHADEEARIRAGRRAFEAHQDELREIGLPLD